MKKFKFKKIDAFTKGGSAGNPAACIYLDDFSHITEEEMQKIAAEMKGYVSEVGYIFRGDEINLRYFSAECEVNFCGHATIALMHDLIKKDKYLSEKEVVKIKVKQDILDVFNDIAQNDSVFITAPKPLFNNIPIENSKIAQALNISDELIASENRIAVINAGLNTLIVPIKKLDDILTINPEQSELKEFCLKYGIDIVEVFSKEVANSTNNYRTRVFAPKFGYLEDPATGSGNSAFGYYLLEAGLWEGDKITLEQNGSFGNPNTVALKTVRIDNELRVAFGGSAVVRIEGEYILHG